MALLLSVLACLLPTLLYVGIVYWVDHFEQEPVWLLSATFFWGAIPAVGLSILFNRLLMAFIPSDVLTVPIAEEVAKALALVGVFLFMRHEIDSLLDGVVYGAMVGLGFGMVENFLYFMAQYDSGGWSAWQQNVLFRAFLFGLNHALYTSIAGVGFALARFGRNRLGKLVPPLFLLSAAIFIHISHNLLLSISALLCLFAWMIDLLGVALIGLIVVWALWQERRWIRRYLAEEVYLGTLTAQQFAIASSTRLRWRHLWRELVGHGWRSYWTTARTYHRISELAYKKRHFEMFGAESDQLAAQKLRAEIAK